MTWTKSKPHARARKLLGQQHWPIWRRHAAVVALGGLVHPGTLPLLDRETLGCVRSLFRSAGIAAAGTDWEDRLEGLSLVFVDAESANALAIEDPPRRAIIVQTGLVRRLWAMARLATGASRLLEDSFACSAPDESLGAFAQPQVQRALFADPGASWPADREGYLFELFMYAAEFVVSHELAHHARGHIDLLSEELGVRQINEGLSVARPFGDAGGCLEQLLELDADTQAIDLILHADLGRGLRTWLPDRKIEHAFKLMLSAILVFMVFDIDHLPIPAPWEGSHPAPVLRAMWVTHTVATSFEHNGLLDTQALQVELEDAWAQAAEVAKAMGLPEGRWWGMGDLMAFKPQLDALSEEAVAFGLALDKRNLAG